MLIKEKERRKKTMELYSLVTGFLLCPKQAVWAFRISLSARFMLERMCFSKYSLVTCSPACFQCLMLVPFQHWYSPGCYLVQVLLILNTNSFQLSYQSTSLSKHKSSILSELRLCSWLPHKLETREDVCCYWRHLTAPIFLNIFSLIFN